MILDTNALSAWWGGETAFTPVLESASRLFVPVPVLAEFKFGVRQSRMREEMSRWVEAAMESTTILPADRGTADHYVEIRLALKSRGTPIPANDLWIAAISRQHGQPIASRDAHFDLIEGVRRIVW
jgi:tRNA(fMet)-specific endonuclease VapC